MPVARAGGKRPTQGEKKKILPNSDRLGSSLTAFLTAQSENISGLITGGKKATRGEDGEIFLERTIKRRPSRGKLVRNDGETEIKRLTDLSSKHTMVGRTKENPKRKRENNHVQVEGGSVVRKEGDLSPFGVGRR